MDDFGSFLKDKRNRKGLTLRKLSKLCYLDASQLSRWETGRVLPLSKHRPDLLKIAKILNMDESEKNDLLVKAGLTPLQPDELDVDAILSGMSSRRSKSWFLCERMKWTESQAATKLGVPFFDIRRDVEEVKAGLGEPLAWQQIQHISSLQNLVRSVIESWPTFDKMTSDKMPRIATWGEDSWSYFVYGTLYRSFMRLFKDARWPSLESHLGGEAHKIRQLIDDFESTMVSRQQDLLGREEAETVIHAAAEVLYRGGLSVIAGSGDTEEWRRHGLKPTCPDCPILRLT